MLRFYPSSAAFMIGDTVMTKYDSGCLRSILLKSKLPRIGEIPQVYMDVGAAHEAQHEQALAANPAVTAYHREFQVRRPITRGVEYSGRIDFLVHYWGEGESYTVIDETKGTVSKNTRRDVIRKGEWNVSYLAQLCSYMVKQRTTRGRLVHGYYEEDADGKLVKQEERVFKVTIESSGVIAVDGEPSGFNVRDLLAHELAAASVLETESIEARPDKWQQKYGGPCTSCAFKSACDTFDTMSDQIPDTAVFVELARESALAAAETAAAKPQPVAFKVKVKKQPKGEKQ